MSRRSKSARAGPTGQKRTTAAPNSKPAADAALADTNIRDAIAEALAQLATLEAEQADFRATFDRAKAASAAELQALQGRLDLAEGEKRDLAAALEAAQSLHADLAALRDAHAATVAEASAARDALAETQTRHADAIRRIAEVEQDLAETTARAQADRLADTQRADDLAHQARNVVEALEAQLQEAGQHVADLSAQHERTWSELALASEQLARMSKRLAAADEETALARQNARLAQTRAEALADDIVRQDNVCAALRIENRDRQQRIETSVRAHALVEERLRAAERRIAEADHALALHELRRQAWQDSAVGRFSRKLLRMRRRWSALTSAFTRTQPNPLFDEAFYLASNPDIAFSGKDAYRHYLKHGAREGRDPNPLFATAWYLKTNPDVAASGVNPLVHYYDTGAAQLRDPHPDFSTRAWLDTHPDAAASGVNPLEHVLRTARIASVPSASIK